MVNGVIVCCLNNLLRSRRDLMFIDSAKFNCGSSGAECCYRRHTSRSAGARPEGVAAAINIWSLGDQAYSSHTHYYPTTRTATSLAGFSAFYEMGSETIDINFISIKPF